MSKFSANKEYEKGVLYCTVRWSNHNNNVNQFLSTNYAEEKYTDVAIACEGQIIKAHKMILAGCSPYFETLFNNYDAKLQPPGQSMCIVLDGMGIAYPTLQLILEFMYGGEIRVKKSELESLVKGGVKLKVKGLDAVKLADKQPDKPNEARTVIGRSELKSPQMVKLASTPRPPAQSARELQMRRRVVEIAHKTPTLNNSKAPTTNSPKAPSANSPRAPAQRVKIPVSQKPVPLPMIALKREPPDTGKVSDDPQTPQKNLMSQRSEPSSADSHPSSQEVKDSTTPATTKLTNDEPAQPGIEDMPRSSPRGRSRSRSRSHSRKPSVEPAPAATPEKPSEQPEEPASSDPVAPEQKSEEAELKVEDGDENGEPEAEPISKRRTIKKPARWSDPDFVKEINIPPMKKRRVRDSPSRKKLAEENSPSKKKLAQENAEPAPGEETAPAEPAKRRKGVFSIFCQEFREKLQAENPGESNSEITKRLSTMWKNLDSTEKEKYCQPPKVNKK